MGGIFVLGGSRVFPSAASDVDDPVKHETTIDHFQFAAIIESSVDFTTTLRDRNRDHFSTESLSYY